MKLHVSANTLASFLTAKTPERKLSIVRAARRAFHNDRDYAPYYQSLKTPARKFLAGGALDPEGLLQLIKRMSKPKTNRRWHKTDALITAEAAKAIIALAPKLRELDVTFVLARHGTKAKLEYPDIDLLVTPDMFVEKRTSKHTRVGAMRLYTAKEERYALGQKGAELIAVMEHEWLVRIASANAMPDASLCMVIECFQQRITHAPADTERLSKIIAQGCHDFAHVWHGLDSQDAA